MPGSRQGSEADITEGEGLTAPQFDVHSGRMQGLVGHAEDAEECLARLARPQDCRIAGAGVDLRLRSLPQMLSPAGMISVGVRE